MLELKNLANYKRYLIESSDLLIVRGSINPVLSGMSAYHARHNIALPPNDLKAFIQELLAAAALAAVSITDRESWGWSLAFKGMRYGFFIGLEPEGMICMRMLESDGEKAAGMVQRQKAGLPLSQSHITLQAQNPCAAVEQYFSEAVQSKVRLAVSETGEGVLAHALPNGNFDLVKDLSAGELFAFAQNAIASEQVKELGEALLFYECRCSEEMISRMIANMSAMDRIDLFGDQQQLKIECPRCGRKYSLPNPDLHPGQSPTIN